MIIVQFLFAMHYHTFALRSELLLYIHPSSAIVHFVKSDVSVGPQVGAKHVSLSAFYTNEVPRSATNFGAKLKVLKRFENDVI